jgi:hypothetical protein
MRKLAAEFGLGGEFMRIIEERQRLRSRVLEELGITEMGFIDPQMLQQPPSFGSDQNFPFEQGLRQTVRWYLDNDAW